MSLKVDSCLPQMSEACWSRDCGSTNRIPGYMRTNSSLVVNVNVSMSSNSGQTRGLYYGKCTCFKHKYMSKCPRRVLETVNICTHVVRVYAQTSPPRLVCFSFPAEYICGLRPFIVQDFLGSKMAPYCPFCFLTALWSVESYARPFAKTSISPFSYCTETTRTTYQVPVPAGIYVPGIYSSEASF